MCEEAEILGKLEKWLLEQNFSHIDLLAIVRNNNNRRFSKLTKFSVNRHLANVAALLLC